ncbi:Transcriptional regulator OS=Streptomyces microflavus OX=1919 GN=Smic_21690 PE=4 SV=1 [Streptomyces microflavus]
MPDDLDSLVAARMERQRYLEREQPPLTWVVLDEAVLYRPIGGHEVMRARLGRLLEFASNRWMQIQVLPFEAGEHASLDGSFDVLRFDGDPDLIYTEDLVSSHVAGPTPTRSGRPR